MRALVHRLPRRGRARRGRTRRLRRRVGRRLLRFRRGRRGRRAGGWGVRRGVSGRSLAVAAASVGVARRAGLAGVVGDAPPPSGLVQLPRVERAAQGVLEVAVGIRQPAHGVPVARVDVGALVASRPPHLVVVVSVVGAELVAGLDGGDAEEGHQGERGCVSLRVDVHLAYLDVRPRALVCLGHLGAALVVDERPALTRHGVLACQGVALGPGAQHSDGHLHVRQHDPDEAPSRQRLLPAVSQAVTVAVDVGFDCAWYDGAVPWVVLDRLRAVCVLVRRYVGIGGAAGAAGATLVHRVGHRAAQPPYRQVCRRATPPLPRRLRRLWPGTRLAWAIFAVLRRAPRLLGRLFEGPRDLLGHTVRRPGYAEGVGFQRGAA